MQLVVIHQFVNMTAPFSATLLTFHFYFVSFCIFTFAFLPLHFYHYHFIWFVSQFRLIFLVRLYVPASQTTAIVVYTSWERHALVGSDVRLSCSFFSWQWTSPDVTFSWHYRPDGARDSVAVRRNKHTHKKLTIWTHC